MCTIVVHQFDMMVSMVVLFSIDHAQTGPCPLGGLMMDQQWMMYTIQDMDRSCCC